MVGFLVWVLKLLQWQNWIQSSRADSRVKVSNFSTVSGTDSVPFFIVLLMAWQNQNLVLPSQSVPETLENSHSLTQLSVWEDFFIENVYFLIWISARVSTPTSVIILIAFFCILKIVGLCEKFPPKYTMSKQSEKENNKPLWVWMGYIRFNGSKYIASSAQLIYKLFSMVSARWCIVNHYSKKFSMGNTKNCFIILINLHVNRRVILIYWMCIMCCLKV